MKKVDHFFRGMAMLCLGIILGFLISPIKKGVRISIGNNNQNSRLMNQGDDLDDWFDDGYYDEDDEEDETSDDSEEEDVPF